MTKLYNILHFFCFKILSPHGSWSQNILFSLASDKWQVTWVWFSFYAFSGFSRWSENKWPVRVIREELFYEHFWIGSSWNSLLLKALSRNEFAWRDDLNMGCNRRNLLRLQLVEANVYMNTNITGIDLEIFDHDIGKSMSSSLPPSKFFRLKPEILQPSSILAAGRCSEDVRLFAYWHDLKGILPLCSKIKQFAANERRYFMWYVKQERPCRTTFQNFERRVKNTMHSGEFLTNFKKLGNVVTHCL